MLFCSSIVHDHIRGQLLQYIEKNALIPAARRNMTVKVDDIQKSRKTKKR